jgi:hypothetical protein
MTDDLLYLLLVVGSLAALTVLWLRVVPSLMRSLRGPTRTLLLPGDAYLLDGRRVKVVSIDTFVGVFVGADNGPERHTGNPVLVSWRYWRRHALLETAP